MNKKRKWMAWELDYLCAHYATQETDVIAAHLSRSRGAVHQAARLMQLAKDAKWLKARQRQSGAKLAALDLGKRFVPVHGHAAKKQAGAVYNAWWAMRQRCERQTHKSFNDYGGRGVTVCERWKFFVNFLEDMGDRPAGTSIGRIDNSKGYEPGNCRWETQKEQQNNRRSNRLAEAFGKRMTMSQWADECGLRQDTLTYRVDVMCMRLEDAMAMPLRGVRK